MRIWIVTEYKIFNIEQARDRTKKLHTKQSIFIYLYVIPINFYSIFNYIYTYIKYKLICTQIYFYLFILHSYMLFIKLNLQLFTAVIFNLIHYLLVQYKYSKSLKCMQPTSNQLIITVNALQTDMGIHNQNTLGQADHGLKMGSKSRNYEWYQTLKKPVCTPPRWVFPVVWTILYISMGVSFYFYLRDIDYKITEGIEGIVIFGIQLLFNFLWTPLFFWNKMITAALVDIAFLWCAIGVTIYFFFLKSMIAGYLLIPYQVWVTLATYLNFYIVRQNDDPSRTSKDVQRQEYKK